MVSNAVVFKVKFLVLLDFLNIFSSDDYLESWDSIDKGICLKIDNVWFDSLYVYVILLLGLQKGW